MNLNFNQIILIIMGTLGVIVASTAQLTELVGPTETKVIVSIASLALSIMSGVLAAITGQGSQVRGVLQMPGIEKITVNEKANPTLAAIAVDPAQLKIEPTQSASNVVEKTAKG